MNSVLDQDLIKEIINRCISLALRDVLSIKDVDNSARIIEWCPVWTWNRDKQKKAVKRILVRTKGQEEFKKFTKDDAKSTGLYFHEILEYLVRSDATRVTIIKS
jgi:hypothetical protein